MRVRADAAEEQRMKANKGEKKAKKLDYDQELAKLQVELVKLQE